LQGGYTNENNAYCSVDNYSLAQPAIDLARWAPI